MNTSNIVILIIWLLCYVCLYIKSNVSKDKKYKTSIGNFIFNKVHPCVYVFILCLCTWIIVIEIIGRLVNYVHYH